MKKSFKKIFGYFLGYMCIYSIIPEVGLKEFCMVTLGGCIIVLSAILTNE